LILKLAFGPKKLLGLLRNGLQASKIHLPKGLNRVTNCNNKEFLRYSLFSMGVWEHAHPENFEIEKPSNANASILGTKIEYK